MGNLTLQGATSGQITLTPTAVAGTNTITFPAGTGTGLISPIPAAALTGTPSAGAIEYDGKVFYGTPQGTQRGVIPGQQFYRLNADLAGANVATAQSTFGVGVTLSASTVYAFDGVILLSKTAGVTSHTVSFGFGGTATINNILYNGLGSPNQTSTTIGTLGNSFANVFFNNANTASPVVFTGAITTATYVVAIRVTGAVSINAGGTFIPQYTISAAPGGAYSTASGSYFLIYPIGTSGANTSVGAWA